MSRYTGPSWKVSRRLGYSTLETGRELAKRDYAPGAHGNDRRKKKSEYGLQLAEKQKLRMTYGVSERQFQRLYIMAKKEHGVTGLNFMRILETRLDNLVFRLGFARTRRGARQLVAHGHITVDGKRVDIPSYLVSVGQVISIREKDLNLKVINEALEVNTHTVPYVELDKDKKKVNSLDFLKETNSYKKLTKLLLLNSTIVSSNQLNLKAGKPAFFVH